MKGEVELNVFKYILRKNWFVFLALTLANMYPFIFKPENPEMYTTIVYGGTIILIVVIIIAVLLLSREYIKRRDQRYILTRYNMASIVNHMRQLYVDRFLTVDGNNTWYVNYISIEYDDEYNEPTAIQILCSDYRGYGIDLKVPIELGNDSIYYNKDYFEIGMGKNLIRGRVTE